MTTAAMIAAAAERADVRSEVAAVAAPSEAAEVEDGVRVGLDVDPEARVVDLAGPEDPAAPAPALPAPWLNRVVPVVPPT